jgi:hypothetical protein
MDHRDFTRRYFAFMGAWAKVSCVGILVILLIIIVTNLIW